MIALIGEDQDSLGISWFDLLSSSSVIKESKIAWVNCVSLQNSALMREISLLWTVTSHYSHNVTFLVFSTMKQLFTSMVVSSLVIFFHEGFYRLVFTHFIKIIIKVKLINYFKSFNYKILNDVQNKANIYKYDYSIFIQ